MIVGAAGDQLHATPVEHLRDDAGVLHDGVLVRLELRLERLLQRHGLGRDHVHQRAALSAGEDGGVDLPGNGLVVGEDHAAAGTAQGLVVGGGHHVRIGNRAGMLARRHQTGDVGHVHHQVRAALLGDLPEAGEIDHAGIGRRTGDDHPRAVLQRKRAHLVVVDAPGGRIAAVGHDVVELAGEVRRTAVGQVSAVAQIHAHHGVAGLAQRQIGRVVRLGAAVGLHVCVLRPEELLRPVDAHVLDLIDKFAAAVVALARITLGILVGQHGAHRGHHRRGDDVLGRDQLQVGALTAQFTGHDVGDDRIGVANEVDVLLLHGWCPPDFFFVCPAGGTKRNVTVCAVTETDTPL